MKLTIDNLLLATLITVAAFMAVFSETQSDTARAQFSMDGNYLAD